MNRMDQIIYSHYSADVKSELESTKQILCFLTFFYESESQGLRTVCCESSFIFFGLVQESTVFVGVHAFLKKILCSFYLSVVGIFFLVLVIFHFFWTIGLDLQKSTVNDQEIVSHTLRSWCVLAWQFCNSLLLLLLDLRLGRIDGTCIFQQWHTGNRINCKYQNCIIGHRVYFLILLVILIIDPSLISGPLQCCEL